MVITIYNQNCFLSQGCPTVLSQQQYPRGSTYHIAIYTGNRGGSGTTATVHMIISGKNLDSEAFILKNEDRPMFMRGSVESFLLSVEEVCYVYAIYFF